MRFTAALGQNIANMHIYYISAQIKWCHRCAMKTHERMINGVVELTDGLTGFSDKENDYMNNFLGQNFNDARNNKWLY